MSYSDLSRDRLISELALARQELSMLRTALDSGTTEFALQTADLLQVLSDDFVFWLDSGGKFIHTKFSTNPRSPIPPYELVGHHYREVTPPQFCQGLDAVLPRLGAAEQVEKFEAEFPTADGKPGWFEVRLMHSNHEGVVMGVVRDITTSFNALSDLKHRAVQLATVAKISTAVSTVLDLDEMLQAVVELTREHFGLYHTHIYLLDSSNQKLVLTTGAGEIGKKMTMQGHEILISMEQSLVARAARDAAAVIVNDVRRDPGFLPNPLLPDTRSEMSVPLVVGDRVLGVLDVQSNIVENFSREDADIFTTLASQVAVAVQNARQFAELADSETMVRQLINSTPDWIFIKDLQHRYVLTNEGYASALHMTSEMMLGKDDLELGFPEEMVKGNPEKGLAGFWEDDNAVFESGQSKIIPSDLVQIDGLPHIFHTYKTPVRDGQGKIIGVLAFARDVTEIKENQKKLSEALSAASMAYWEFDVRTGMFTFNDDFYAVYGTSAAREGGYQMPAQVYAEKFVHPEDAAKVGEEIGKALQTADPHYHAIAEARIIRVDGQVRDTIVRFNIEKDADGNTTRLFGANQDITERKQAEREMEAQQRILQAVLDNMTAGVFMVEAPSGRPILSNKRAEEFLGRGISPSAIGDTLTDVYAAYRIGTDELYPTEETPIVAGLMGISKRIDDMEVCRPDGSRVQLEIEGSPVYDAAGNLVASVVVFGDITERARTEKVLEDQRRTLQAVLDNMPAGVFMVEAPSGRPILSNRRAEEFLGRGISPDAIGDTLSEVYAAYRFGTDELYPSEQMPIVAGLFGQSKTIDDMEVRRPDGSKLLLEVNGSPVYDVKGNLAASVVVFTDITERRKNQDALAQRAREMATVAELGTAISAVLEPEEMLQQVADLVKERFGLYHAHLYLMNPAGDTLLLRAGAGETGRMMVAEGRFIPLAAEKSLVARAARGRQGVIVNDVLSDPEFLPHPLLPDTRSELAVPLLIGERVLGVLDVQSQYVGTFGDEDVNIQMTLAAQIAVVLENVRQYTALAESETMVRQLINSTPDWIFIKDLEHRYALVNEGYASSLHMKADEMLGKDDLELGFPEEMVKGNPEKGLSGFWADDQAVFDSNQSKIIPNDLVQIDGEPHIFHTFKTPVHDIQGKVSGVLAFARDVTDREKLLDENRRLYEVSRRLNNAANYEDMILAMIDGLEVNQFDQSGLLRLDRAENGEPVGFTVLAHWKREDLTPNLQVLAGDHFSFEEFPAVNLLTAREALFISDLETDSRLDPTSQAFLREIASRSTALLPLYLGDVQIGAMTLQSTDVRTFNTQEMRFLPIVSNQLAVAVQNRILFDQTKEALSESQALYKVNAGLSSAQTMADILVAVSQPSIDVGANVAQLFVAHLDDQKQPREVELVANWVAHEGATVSPLGTRFDVTQMFFTRYWAAHPDEPMLISDVATDPNLDEFSRELLVRTKTGAVAVLPMVIEGVMAGVILIKWGHTHNFSNLEQRLYQTLSGPAAIVVNSRLLFERLARNEAQLSEALEIASLAYWEFDVATQNFLFNDDYYHQILHTTAEEAGGYLMPAMKFATQYVSPESSATVPATIRAAIETTDPNFTTETESRLICGDGKLRHIHMLLKIQKDSAGNTVKLFGTNQDITERKQAEAMIARRAEDLATVAHLSTTVSTILDPDQMLQSVVDLTRERFDLYHAHIYLYNEVEDLLELRSGAGEVGRQLVAQKRAIPLSVEQSLVARAARTHQGVIVNDVREDPGFLPNPLLSDTRAEMAIPMLLGERVLGVLDVQSNTVGRFTDEDVAILTTLASQVAVALQNGRAYLRAQRQAEREALLNTISERIQATTSVENALQVAVRELGRALGAQRTTVQIRLDDNESGSQN